MPTAPVDETPVKTTSVEPPIATEFKVVVPLTPVADKVLPPVIVSLPIAPVAETPV